ncbi:unnamed protein product [Lymnaea stagnalis]|uniref:HMG box domain-containing protein n=1 Tax=Lymnaea stagnalis TaxID=6523 RepID=A0AAV2I270_LYMST
MNAFMIWAQGARRLINELCPKMQNAIISEALGFYWRQKSEAFKKKFEDEKVKLRRFHNVEFPEYKYKPKTKVQKAKEKQELSLTKAKMRASVKREKLKQSEDANLFKRRPATRVGRPKKLQMSTVTSNVTSAVTSNITTSETPKSNSEPSTTATTAEPETSHPAMSPSKPAIKNMLSLKLLNDRLSKGSMYPTSRGEVQTAFGQLSPLEVDSPGMNDMFEELSHHDARESARDADTSDLHKNTSSVYDTPANTPPLDDNHDTHHSPAQTQLSPASPPHVIASSASVAPPTSCSSAPTPSPRHITMPSLSAILSTPSKNIQNAQNLIALTTANANLLADSRSQATNELTDFVLTYMSATSVHKSNVALAIDRNNNRATIDANNNESDFNNNNTSSGSHGGTILVRNLGLPPSYTASVRNFRLSSAFNEPSDLDSLSLDLNTPLLSEDEMTSLLFSLRGQYTS